METISAEVVDTGTKRDAKGRKLAVMRERQALIALYERSGMTQRAFTEREGVTFATFAGWLKRHRDRESFTEVKVKRPSSGLEVMLPTGIVVRGADVEQMADLIKRLGC